MLSLLTVKQIQVESSLIHDFIKIASFISTKSINIIYGTDSTELRRMCDRSNGQQNNPSTSSSFPQFNHIQVVSNRRPNREESIQISPHFPINLPYNFMYGAIPHMVLNQNYFYRANQGSGRQAVAGIFTIFELYQC